MRPRPRPSRLLITVAAVVVLAVAALVLVLVQVGHGSDGISRAAADRQVQIPAAGGVSLEAEAVRPKGAGPFPLVVMPTSLGSRLTEYRGLIGELVGDGYEVVTYVQRGFRGSGGEVDLGGTPTQRDVSTVIDWTLAHEPVDRNRIGAFGRSYGAGVALLAAARDKRIRAVVATSGWADFAGVFDENDTTSAYALPALLTTSARSGRLSAQLTQLRTQLATDPSAAGATVRAMSATRSAARVVGKLDANGTAIMLASGYEDSILPPTSLVDFYDRLTGPKRLQLAPGDHGGPEASGLLGDRNAVTDAARAWLDRYVKGDANGIDRRQPVQLEDVATHQVHGFARWPAARTTLALGRPGTPGNATARAAGTWRADLAGGVDTAAGSGPSTIATTAAYQPPRIALAAVNTGAGATWTTAATGSDVVIAGRPQLSLDVSSSTGSATLFAYLYDVDPSGAGSLMSVTPYTVTAASTPRAVSFALSPTGWTIARGHRLALVVDTVDHRWRSLSTPGSTVHLASTAADPATLALPVADHTG